MGNNREEIYQFRNPVDWRASNERSSDPDGGQTRLLYMRDLKKMLRGLGEDVIYALLRSGEIPARKIGGKWATTNEAVERWLSSITNGIDMGDPFAASKERES